MTPTLLSVLDTCFFIYFSALKSDFSYSSLILGDKDLFIKFPDLDGDKNVTCLSEFTTFGWSILPTACLARLAALALSICSCLSN